MGEAYIGSAVYPVKDLSAFVAQLFSFVYRLAASAGASAGTCHDFDEIVAYRSLFYGGDEILSVLEHAYYGDIDSGAFDFKCI